MAESPALNRIRTRAMHRALARLRDLHRTEYEELLVIELRRARLEAAEHISKAKREHPGQQPPTKPSNVPGPKFQPRDPLPPKLLRGPRPNPVLAEDVAACPYCHRYHQRGHECPSCRHRPAGAPPANPYKASA